MSITTISSREFNHDTSGPKKATREGPVIITDRGKPAHVLLSIEEYQKLTGIGTSIVELLVMPDAPDIDFDTEVVFKAAAWRCSTRGLADAYSAVITRWPFVARRLAPAGRRCRSCRSRVGAV